MLSVDKLSRIPIYEQVIEQVQGLIAREMLRDGDLLPSVRVLSQQLSVNPNTLQKAYTELERRGLCYTVPGSGRYIAKNARSLVVKNLHAQQQDLADSVAALSLSGMTLDEVIGFVKQAYTAAREKVKEDHI